MPEWKCGEEPREERKEWIARRMGNAARNGRCREFATVAARH